jgi:1-pyrroline-5-carboxylate dehydrogenase
MATAEQKLHVPEFTNEPYLDYSQPAMRKKMEEALKQVKSEFGREYPMWIGGQKVTTADKRSSTNPSRPSEVIGIVQHANAQMARRAVEAAHQAFDSWKKVPFQERAMCLFRAAQIVRERRHELNALVCYEVGKSWAEADGDVAETVDFCEFYGREMLRLGEPQTLTPMRGERNYLTYIPLGVGAVIPPWNFPCAIMAGLVVASLVTGNTVVVKPAGDSPIIAAKFVDILFEAGIPKDAIQFITGPCSIPRLAISVSLVRKKSACASANLPVSASPAKCGSSARYSKWVAKTPLWWMKKRTLTPQWKAQRKPHSATRVRSARRVRAPSSLKKSTIPS